MKALLKAKPMVVLELTGEYPSTDRDRLHAFSRKLLAVLDERGIGTVVVDFGRVKSAGAGILGVLARAYRMAQVKRLDLMICGLSPATSPLFELTRLDRVWNIFADRRTAAMEAGNPRASTTIRL